MYGKYSEIYSRWCDYYDFDSVEFKTISKYVSVNSKNIIDIGCGTGRFLFRFLPYVKSAIAIDNDECSIAVLNDIISNKFNRYASKITTICSDIENFQTSPKSIDIAVFSWSLYSLNKEQMERAIYNVFNMLNAGGVLIILQPIGGEFETIMRLFFREHEDRDEYKECIKNMNEIIPTFFDCIAVDKIVSNFTFPDLEEFCEILKMFAVTEGGCEINKLEHINLNTLNLSMSCYKREYGFSLEDEVSLFIYKKK